MTDPTRRPGYSRARTHPDGVTVLVLGIIGVVIPLVAFPAWFVGNRALADARRHPGRYDDLDLVRVGRMLGKVVSIAMMFAFLAYVAIFLFYVTSAGER